MKSCEGCAVRAFCQPYGDEHIVDGVGIKEMRIPVAGTWIPQHSHEYDHISYLSKGSVVVYREDELAGDQRDAPFAIHIPAGVKHTFVSMEDDCLILCIHNVSRNGTFEVREEHQFIGSPECPGEQLLAP